MTMAAVILAGGTAARLGGVDKASIEYAGRTLLEHAIAAVGAAEEVVVVGPEVPTSRPVTFTREDPPLGGPAAGVLAGILALARRPDHVLVLAVDMPMVSTATVDRLLAAARDHEGAVLVDEGGRHQPAFVVREEALPDASGGFHGRALRSLTDGLDLAEVPAVGDEAAGVDTWTDLRDLPRT